MEECDELRNIMQKCNCGKEVWSKGMCSPCYGKDWYQKNKDKVQARKAEYYQENREKEIKKALKWNKENPEKVRKAKRKWEKSSEYYKKKYHSNLEYRLAVILRNRLRTAMRCNFKTGRTLELLGCSLDFFKEYIEVKWQPGMSWDNHSLNGWHIDHIKPLKSFRLEDPEELKKAAHYTNLQPLWASENIKKKDNYM